jgi:hypothetical protein
MTARDYNNNGSVDAVDYTFWRDTSSSTTNLAADVNSNGIIDADEYNFWRSRFEPISGGGSMHAAVPELSAIGLALLTIALASSRHTLR